MKDLLRAGKIVKTHGINGEVLIKFEVGKVPANTKEPVFLDFEGIQVPFFVQSVRVSTPIDWFVVFDDYNSLSRANLLLGRQVFVPADSIVKSDELTIADLVDFEVLDEKQGRIGRLLEIVEGRQDLMIIERDGKEVLIPFVEDFILEIDDENKRIIVDIPDGLLDMNR